MPSLHSKRKRQSRLSFTPVSSSSPAAKDYNKQIQDRAAAVTLDLSPSPTKRRKHEHDPGDKTQHRSSYRHASPVPAVLTPAASLEPAIREASDESDSDTVLVQQQRRTIVSKQRQIDFSRARDPSTFDPPFQLVSSKRQHRRDNTMFSSPSTRVIDVSSENSEDDHSTNADVPSARQLASQSRAQLPKSTLKTTSDSDSDDVVISSARKRVHISSEDDGDDMPTTRGSQLGRKGRAAKNVNVGDRSSESEDDDEDLRSIRSPGRRRRRRRNGQATRDSREQSPVREAPQRRSIKQPELLQREQEELAEDLDDLASSGGDSDKRRPRRTRPTPKTARAKALEKLKRSRSGNNGDIEEDDDTLNRLDISEQSDDDNNTPPTSSRQMFRADDGDADFLVDDDDEDELLGVPTDIPLQYTRFASMKPKELFKYAAEWFVQRKINPAYKRDDEIYGLTFKKLDDEVKGLAGSKFTSAAWTPEFTMALQARPDIVCESIDRTLAEHFARDKCDACNRSSHPATYQIQFQGRPYYSETLEDVAQGDDEDDDSDATSSESETDNTQADDMVAVNSLGREVAPANKVYYVGKFCCANAKTAHSLNHWRYHLNEWVETWLVAQGYCTPNSLARRDKWKTEKRRKYANKIVDRMEEEGVVKSLWKDFSNNITEARNSKQGRFTYDSP